MHSIERSSSGVGVSRSGRSEERASGEFLDRTVERGSGGRPRAGTGSGGVLGFFKSLFQRTVTLPPPTLQQLARSGTLASSDLARFGLADAAELTSILDRIGNHPEHRDAVEAFKAVLPDAATAYELLGEAPATHREITAHIKRLETVERALDDHGNDLASTDFGDIAANGLRDGVKSDVDALKQSVTNRIAYLKGMAAANPMSEKNIFSAKALYIDAAIKVMAEKIADLASQGKDPTDREVVVLTNALKVLDKRKQDFAQLSSDETVQGKLKDFMGEKKPTLSAKRLMSKVMRGMDLSARGDYAMPTHHKGMREQAILERFLGRAFKQAGVKPPDLKHALHDAHIKALNEQDWGRSSKEVRFSHDGRDARFTSNIDPQGQLGNKYAGMGGRGINCHSSKEHGQGVNVARTELRDAHGNTLMQGIRHGVNCAYGISTKALAHMPDAELRDLVRDLLPKARWERTSGAPDLGATVARMRESTSFRRECGDVMRANANLNRAKDVVATALVLDPAKLGQAVLESRNGTSPPTVTLNISSISLMTPDLARSWKSGNAMAGDNERRMVPEQIDAWNKLTAGSPITLKVEDPGNPGTTVDVQVNVEALAFNFGVNQGAVTGVGPVSSKAEVVSGWKLADRHNQVAMDKLIGGNAARKGDDEIHGRVGAWLQQNPTHSKAAVVEKLAWQVERMWEDGSYKTQGNEPYKMVSRLVLLNHLIGDVAAWNCKSGKDRTGELDVEAKFLAAQIELTGDVPEPDHERTAQERAQFFQMAISSGNHQMQQLNTGGMGFKLEGVDALSRQMGADDNDPHVAIHRGVSKFFES